MSKDKKTHERLQNEKTTVEIALSAVLRGGVLEAGKVTTSIKIYYEIVYFELDYRYRRFLFHYVSSWISIHVIVRKNMPTGSLSTILKAIFGGNVAALMVEIVLKLWHAQRSKSTRISEMTENLRLVHRLFEDITYTAWIPAWISGKIKKRTSNDDQEYQISFVSPVHEDSVSLWIWILFYIWKILNHPSNILKVDFDLKEAEVCVQSSWNLASSLVSVFLLIWYTFVVQSLSYVT